MWQEQGLNHTYRLVDTSEPEEFLSELRASDQWGGCNVTIPYKRWIIDHLDEISPQVKVVGAVNTVVRQDGKLVGYNTDVDGFRRSLIPLLTSDDRVALVLGSGGAAQSVLYVLNELEISTMVVSRHPHGAEIAYTALTDQLISEVALIVNTTPLGSTQYQGALPSIPYDAIDGHHLLYDLIYSPMETPFLREGRARGARTINGMKMLEEQAKAAWEIYSDKLGL